MRGQRETAPYAGIEGTFYKVPFIEGELSHNTADIVIIGAPVDEGTSNRPGARFGPGAIRAAYIGGGPPRAPHIELGVDPFEVLRVVDKGDASVVPGDMARNHAAIKQVVSEILSAGAIPVVLGGDHSILHANATALAEHFTEDVGIIHFDAHADTAEQLYGVRESHGTPVRRLVEDGAIRGDRIMQIGLRGYWPGPDGFDWARKQGIEWITHAEIQKFGLDNALTRVIDRVSEWDRIYFSFDIDVVDPSYAPGTGTPEPGGLAADAMLYSVRRLAVEIGFDGMEVVEVSPPYDHSGITALLAHRMVLEAISGLALRKIR